MEQRTRWIEHEPRPAAEPGAQAPSAPSAPSAPRWLERARLLLHERSGGALRMHAIAREVGVHPVHLSRSFHQHFGVTMRRYLRDLRVRRACDALRHTRHPLSRIAMATGFADHAHFTRTFKAIRGLTPTEFRRRACSSTSPERCDPWHALGAGD